MRAICILFAVCCTSVHAQDSISEELTIPIVYHSNYYFKWEFTEITHDYSGWLDGTYDFTAELPYSGTGEDLHHRSFYRTESNRYVEFVAFPGKRFFFKEWKDSLRSDLLHFGEVEIDQSNFRLDSVMFTSMRGEDSLVMDSVFTFRKIGPWEFRATSDSKLYGNYNHGKRTGVWTQYLMDLSSVEFLPVLANYTYENGNLVSTSWLDKSKLNYDEKMKVLNGKWKNYQWDAKTMAMCAQQDLCIVKFHKVEKGKFPSSTCVHVTSGCGTGHTCKEQNWTLNKDNTITIDGTNFIILYLTDEYLMMKQNILKK